ncbi:T9SS C-terminal target domain-containing protein [Fibrisoma montanum]|uniref:T9SS C-terminal target domain-containing protein n=2 Tax=Fibrisoma montanum TaxID=2305895 RepID=A0A418M485_9BACT|nr:T9SS C-terminal target domain-containing protein [Fibrisoma montanum]
MKTTFTASVAQAARWTVLLSLSLLRRSRYSFQGVGWSRPTLSLTRSGHGRWLVALLWLLGLACSTNARAQQGLTGSTVAGGRKGNELNQLDTVQAVFVDRAGFIYVADQVNNRIMKFPPNSSVGTAGTIVAGGMGYGSDFTQLKYPTGVFVDTFGAIYVADRDNHRIMKFPRNSSMGTPGTIVAGYTGQGSAPNQLNTPSGVYLDNDGAIYVADLNNHRIMQFPRNSSMGTPGTVVAGARDGKFGNEVNRLRYPTSVFVDDSKTVYVADAGNNRIMKWPRGASEGTTVAGGNDFGSLPKQLNAPAGVFVDQAGAVYVADYLNNRIMKWSRGASEGTTVVGDSTKPGNGANQLRHPTGVFVDQAGAIYVADGENYRIQKFLPASVPPVPVEVPPTPLTPAIPVAHVGITVAGVTSQPGNETSQLHGPRGLFVDDSRAIYVADQVNNRIMKFPPNSSSDTAGTIVAGNGYGSELNQLGYPTGVALDEQGAIYVSDSANHRIMKFPRGSTTGTFGTTVAGGQGQGRDVRQLDSPGGVVVDGDGAIYVADTKNHRIQKYTPTTNNGILVATVAGNGSQGSGPTQLDNPGGIFLDESGALYVADTRNHRIQKFPPGSNGTTPGTTVAGVGDGTFGNGPNQLHSPSGVYVDELGAIYVADTRNNRIQKWASGPTSGTTVAGASDGKSGNGANQLDYPTGVAVDGAGAIYVADYGNARIQKFSSVHTRSGGLLGGAATPSAFQLIAPLYDCPSGAFSFMTQGGDSSGAPAAPIEYMAAGITGWTTNPNQFVDFELRQAADAQPITLWARQNGQTVRYVWDIRATCPVGAPGQLRLVAPLYDCAAGAITFQTQGGNNSPIEYMAAGITGWTTNPNQFVDRELRQAADAQPLLLRVRQRTSTGAYQEDNYVWDMRAICPMGASGPVSARFGASIGEGPATWQVTVYPNPVGQEFTVKLEGVRQASVRLVLTNLRGQVLVDRQVLVEQATHQERLKLGESPAGIYLLRVSTADQTKTLKVLKGQ